MMTTKKAIRFVLKQQQRGVLGMVDDLLATCGASGFELEWKPDGLRLRVEHSHWDRLSKRYFPKSALRAVIARIAALCNEHQPNSVSPYGGEGRLPAQRNPQSTLRVTFANTPDQLFVRLTPSDAGDAAPTDGNGLGVHSSRKRA